jgi:hypothetical protein
MRKSHICLFQMHDIKEKKKILQQSVQWRITMQTTQESWLISESRMKTRIAMRTHFFLGFWDVTPNLRDKCRHLNSTQHTKWIQLINTCTWNLEFCNYKMVIGLAYPNTKFPLSSLHIHTWWRHTSQELAYLSNG